MLRDTPGKRALSLEAWLSPCSRIDHSSEPSSLAWRVLSKPLYIYVYDLRSIDFNKVLDHYSRMQSLIDFDLCESVLHVLVPRKEPATHSLGAASKIGSTRWDWVIFVAHGHPSESLLVLLKLADAIVFTCEMDIRNFECHVPNSSGLGFLKQAPFDPSQQLSPG